MKKNQTNWNYPKVLVISHNPFSSKQNNGKTLVSFFEGWPKDNIAQLFLTLDEIDTTICSNYFRISDVNVFKYFLNHKSQIGKEITNIEIDNANKDKEKEAKSMIYKTARNLSRKNNVFIWWGRTLLWNIVKPWKKKIFLEWLNKFNPDIVFFQSSSFYPIYNMVGYISDITNAKLFIETTDDYVTPTFSFNIFKVLKDFKMQKEYKKLVKKSECVFAIGEKMASEYKARFGGNYKIAMNSISIKENIKEYVGNKEECILTYAGNLGLNRWKILYKLGMELDSINNVNKIKCRLIICSLNKPNNRVMNKFNSIKSIEYKGALNSEELIDLRNNSDILVHVEAFDRVNKKITRLSISTKIPEYMLSKRCILAIGPKNVASIEYIQNNDFGVVITNKKNKYWKDDLINIVNNNELRKNYMMKAYSLAEKNHIYEKNKEKVQKQLLKEEN